MQGRLGPPNLGSVHGLAPTLLAASDVVGFVLFGVFVVALGVLGVVAVSWAVKHDRAGRRRMLEDHPETGPDATPRGGR